MVKAEVKVLGMRLSLCKLSVMVRNDDDMPRGQVSIPENVTQFVAMRE